MPVRIYDIARKLEIRSKDVLVHAKDLGIENAKVASSSLDKITAEYLEQEIEKKLGLNKPEPLPEPIVAAVSLESGTSKVDATENPKIESKSTSETVSSSDLTDPFPPCTEGGAMPNIRLSKAATFEQDIGRLIEEHCSHTTLSNVLIFDPQLAVFTSPDSDRPPLAIELDHLLHRATRTMGMNQNANL
jgi:hypothetical protein